MVVLPGNSENKAGKQLAGHIYCPVMYFCVGFLISHLGREITFGPYFFSGLLSKGGTFQDKVVHSFEE